MKGTLSSPPPNPLRPFIGAILLPVLLLAAPAPAQESLVDLAPFREGCQALADERFETAVARFRECWILLREDESSGPGENFVASRLLESLVRNGETAPAVAWTLENAGFQPTPATSYWIAAAFQAEERFAEAAEYYQAHLANVSAPPTATLINRAVCLARSGRAAAAHDLVRDISPSHPGETLRLAQIAAAASHETEALARLGDAALSNPAWVALRMPLARLLASLHLRLGNRATAIATASEAVATSPDADQARRALLFLETLLDGETPGDLPERLAAWETDPDFPGREAAALHRLLLEPEPARSEALRAFAGKTADPALRLEALLRIGEAPSPAPPDAPSDLRERLDFAIGSAAYHADRFDEAMRHFSGLLEHDRGEAAARDSFNAALSALRQDDAAAFATHEEAIVRTNPRSSLLAELSYLGGLYLSAKGDPAAYERLNRFVQSHPDHPSSADARLALAEIHLNQAPARPSAAREIFEELRARPLTLAQSERLDYVSIWIELTDGNASGLLRRADEFVANWPNSDYLDEVLMILASEHYSRKDFDAAAAAFHRVAEEFPGSPHARTARFFEAKASPASEEALAKWRRLVEEGEELADEASHELALLLLSLDRFDEARAEFENLLGRLPAESPLRFAVMADSSCAFYLEALAGGKDPALLEKAATRFAALSNHAEAPASWRYNAAVRRGKCLEALGKVPVALEIYRSIVEETRSGNSTAPLPPEEAEWVFRAGFAAIRILEADRKWAAAIEVADALSDKNGPRAIEAAKMAEKLRLKHWVWD